MSPDELGAAWSELWTPGYANLPVYNGLKCQQFQSDLDRYREVIEDTVPDFIINTGVYWGGTTAFMADALSRVNEDGVVIAIDLHFDSCGILPENVITLQGDAASNEIISRVKGIVGKRRGLVQLDDDHSSVQVAKELVLYSDMANTLVVEDTIIEYLDGYNDGDGPHLALKAWLPGHDEFEPMSDPEPTQHVGGWLKRVR